MNYKASIIGFHNPHIHGEDTPEQFLRKYVSSLQAKRFKKFGFEYTRLARFITDNWEDQIKFVKRLFYPTAPKDALVGGQRREHI